MKEKTAMRRMFSGLFFLSLSLSLFGQGIQVGILGGPTFFKSNDDNIGFGQNDIDLRPSKTSVGLGWSAGVLVRSSSSNLFGYDIEIGVTSKAFLQKGELSERNVMFKDHVVYLNLPAHLKIRITPQLSVLLGAEMNYKLNSISFDSFYSGLSNGVSYDLSERLGMRFRYSYGLDNAVEYTLVDINNSPFGPFKKKFHGIVFSGVYYMN